MRTIAGTHLLIDGYVTDRCSLDPECICAMFDKLVEALGMEYLHPPAATFVPLDSRKLAGDDDEGGWSVIAQITTSHIALHGWPLRRAFMMDIFSCRPFDAEAAKKVVYEELSVGQAAYRVIDRRGPM